MGPVDTDFVDKINSNCWIETWQKIWRSSNKFYLIYLYIFFILSLYCVCLLQLAPTKSRSVINAMNFVKNPYKMCEKLYNLVHDLTGQLKDMIAQKVYDPRGTV